MTPLGHVFSTDFVIRLQCSGIGKLLQVCGLNRADLLAVDHAEPLRHDSHPDSVLVSTNKIAERLTDAMHYLAASTPEVGVSNKHYHYSWKTTCFANFSLQACCLARSYGKPD